MTAASGMIFAGFPPAFSRFFYGKIVPYGSKHLKDSLSEKLICRAEGKSYIDNSNI